MRTGFRQSMAWLHAWSGLVVGWVLFAVFVTGTASYYKPEIARWMQPELVAGEALAPEAVAAAVERGVAYMQTHAGEGRAWFITPPRPDRPVIELFWRTRPGGPTGHVLLDPETGEPARVRETRGGDFLYRFHFELHMAPLWGRWIVGICAMIMLVALVSGIVTHRRIFADFFTFRRGAKSTQRGWLDAHNVTGVLALPFHLMITYTGLVTLAVMYMPWGVRTAYDGNAQALFHESGQITRPRPPAGQPGTLAPVGPMVLQAIAAVPETLERVSVQNPKDANATVIAVFEEPHGLSHEHPQVAFAGTTGALLEVRQGALRPATKTFSTMVGLHEAHFAGPVLRLLFFLSGLAGCAMVATGLLLWAVARVPKPGETAGLGLRHVRGLNIAAIAGLPAGIAAFFLANRLLPVDLAGRAEWEVRAFFAAWVAVGLAGILRPQGRAWSEMLTVCAALYAGVAAADGLRIVAGPGQADAVILAFDGAMLALAAVLVLAARKVASRERAAVRNVRRREPAQGAVLGRGEGGLRTQP